MRIGVERHPPSEHAPSQKSSGWSGNPRWRAGHRPTPPGQGAGSPLVWEHRTPASWSAQNM
eukprot:305888-Lingulodinium_polyedra.AAC.1